MAGAQLPHLLLHLRFRLSSQFANNDAAELDGSALTAESDSTGGGVKVPDVIDDHVVHPDLNRILNRDDLQAIEFRTAVRLQWWDIQPFEQAVAAACSDCCCKPVFGEYAVRDDATGLIHDSLVAARQLLCTRNCREVDFITLRIVFEVRAGAMNDDTGTIGSPWP